MIKLLGLSLGLYRTFRRYGIKKVFSVGGYSASPAVFAAIFFRRPLYIHEQNAAVGSLNKITRPFARCFFSSFDAASPCKDYPVERKFYDSRRVREGRNTILFMGGSLGAKAINDLAMESASELLGQGKKLIHLTGKGDFDRVDTFYKTNGLDVTCIAFDRELDRHLAVADFAVSRAGASSLFELYANALPSLFVPYPYAASDHQYYNAMYLAEHRMAYCVREKDLSKAKLFEILEEDHTHLSKKLFDSFSPDGAACITKYLTE